MLLFVVNRTGPAPSHAPPLRQEPGQISSEFAENPAFQGQTAVATGVHLSRQRKRMTYKALRIFILLAVAITLTGTKKSPYGPHETAAYLSPVIIDFLRPGLKISIVSGIVASDGTITVVYTVADPVGLPLDTNGVYTPGPLNIRYVAAYLPKGKDQYVAWTTVVRNGAAGTFTVAGTDTGGVLTQLDNGKYQYVFSTKAPAGFDAGATTSIGVYGSRNMTAFGIPDNFSTAVYNFVPSGDKVTQVRDVVRTTACNTCHDQLSAHGGSRRSVELCIMCHTPQTTDSATGNTVDFKVFIHKLHMGQQLPSVIAGGVYQIGDSDYSGVVFPADPRRCETCHNQKSGAVQAANYLTKPSAAACGACHDNVNFATGLNHAGGPQLSDNLCANCHIPQGEIDFDASIKGSHVIPATSAMLGGLQIALKKVDTAMAGQKPTITFSLLDSAAMPLAPSTLGALSFTMAGSTSDYGYTSFGTDVTTPGYVTESALTAAKCGADGTCTYAFNHAVPANANGSYTIGVEARRTETLLPGTTKQMVTTYGAKNQVISFSVDGSALALRRTVVATAKCEQCHVQFTAIHGGLRNQTEYCVLCHNPSQTDLARRPGSVVAADKALPPQSVNFNMLVHRIHTGENLAALGSGYTVVGFGGSHNDFSDVKYPAMSATGDTGDTKNCSMCHVSASEQTLPLGKNPAIDPQGPVNPNQAIAAACVGCHADRPTASHSLANTDSLGESCTVCHRNGAQFSVGSAHAQY
jgi:OmcA/MtrC family decaheme c-type cytochrome